MADHARALGTVARPRGGQAPAARDLCVRAWSVKEAGLAAWAWGQGVLPLGAGDVYGGSNMSRVMPQEVPSPARALPCGSSPHDGYPHDHFGGDSGPEVEIKWHVGDQCATC